MHGGISRRVFVSSMTATILVVFSLVFFLSRSIPSAEETLDNRTLEFFGSPFENYTGLSVASLDSLCSVKLADCLIEESVCRIAYTEDPIFICADLDGDSLYSGIEIVGPL